MAILALTVPVDCTRARISAFPKTSIVLYQQVSREMAETKSAICMYLVAARYCMEPKLLYKYQVYNRRLGCRNLQAYAVERVIYGGKDGGKKCRSVQKNSKRLS